MTTSLRRTKEGTALVRGTSTEEEDRTLWKTAVRRHSGFTENVLNLTSFYIRDARKCAV